MGKVIDFGAALVKPVSWNITIAPGHPDIIDTWLDDAEDHVIISTNSFERLEQLKEKALQQLRQQAIQELRNKAVAAASF